MIFEQMAVGGDRNFAYLVADQESGKALLVDPAYNQKMVLAIVAQHSLDLIYVVNTHGHYDHSQLSDKIAKATGARVVAHKSSASADDLAVDDGHVLELGSLKVKILHTPGHTPDGICLLTDNKLITGDTLFVGKVGGTDHGPGARAEYDSLFDKLLKLPDDVEVWPGHDYGPRPSSTIGQERRENPFLLCPSFEAFVDLKRNWARYKREHGIK
ncbi:MAG: MBL fold metallo-hydrolase [Actinobacteria bacterium]|nr:MBL fold metallo-hydrolase [Actinomycetota bacterium]